MNKPLLYVLLLTVIGCSIQDKKSPNVFFAGEIVNPTSEYVVLFKDDIIIDSARLDNDNRFSIRLDSPEEGLYHFDHHPELQYVFLEKGDSLMIRLNTEDFDESLIFSGRGEEINNFLIELFLSAEEELPLVYNYSHLEPVQFDHKLDSLKIIKTNLLKELLKETKLSDNAVLMAQASIDYNYFTYKEKYPFWNMRKTGNPSVSEISADFYTYRKGLDYNSEALSYHRYYYNFLKSHFDNLAYMGCKYGCHGKHAEIVQNKLHFNQHRLKLIDSLVKTKNLRDNLFRSVAIDYLVNVHDTEDNNRIFIDDFHRYSSNNKHSSEIEAVYEGVKNMQPSKKLPQVYVMDNSGQRIPLQEIAEREKNTVFYFWSGTQKRHFENISRRVSKLQKTRPEYTFVGINCNTEMTRWQNLLISNNLNPEWQFRTDNFESLKNTLVIGGLNKGIITKDGYIVDGFADLYRNFRD